MQGNPPVLATRGVAFALDSLSKNTLIDFLADLANSTLGMDAKDETKLELIEQWLEPVQIARGDNPTKLLARLQRLQASDRKYVETHPEGRSS